MLVGEEVFWGVAQLDNVAAHLSGIDPLLNLEWAQLAPQGMGAWRRGVSKT
jgi:hypothetical protein